MLLYITCLIGGGLYIGNGAVVGLGLCQRDITLDSDCCGNDQCRWTTQAFHGCGLDISTFVTSGLGVLAPQITIVIFAFYCLVMLISIIYFFATLRKMKCPSRICYQITFASLDIHPAMAYGGFQSPETKEATRVAGTLLSKLFPYHRKIVLRFIWPFSLFLNAISIVVYILLQRSFEAMQEPLTEAYQIGNICNYGSLCPAIMLEEVKVGMCNSKAMVTLASINLCLQSLFGLMFLLFVRSERSHRRRLTF